MKPSDVTAEWNETTHTLAIRFFRDAVTFRPESFCDATYTKKGDVMTLRVAPSMTKFNFEGWTKGKESGSFAAVNHYIEHCERARLAN